MNTKDKRIDFLGCPIDALTMRESIERVEEYIKEGIPRQHVVVNAAKVVQAYNDIKLKDIISSCDMINVDGTSIVWASKLLGSELPERVAGCDLFQELVRLCAEKGYRPFFFGAKEDIILKMVNTFEARYPSLRIAGYRNGYYSANEETAIATQIKNSKADILFVGFSSPKKEFFLNKYIHLMQVPFCMGVGGSFDIIAGKTKRAPKFMQNCGLEWLYRLLQEPKRMWKRYAVTNIVFIYLVLKEFFIKKVVGYRKINGTAL